MRRRSSLQWMVDIYALVFAGLLFTAGTIGDRYGRKGTLQGGLLLFLVGAAVAAGADSAGVVIGARAVMGVAAALVMPSTLSILANVFPPHERGRAIAIWAGVAAGGAALARRSRASARAPVVGLGVPRQRPPRGARPRAGDAGPAEVTGPAGRPLRRRRGAAVDARHRLARVRHHRGAGPRVGIDPHGARLHRGDRVHRPVRPPRAHGPRRCSTCGCSATVDSRWRRAASPCRSSRCSGRSSS